jgi:hypothetical protein
MALYLNKRNTSQNTTPIKNAPKTLKRTPAPIR